MPPVTHDFDIAGMRLRPGEGRRIELLTPLGEIDLGGERYAAEPSPVEVKLEVSRMAGLGHALRIVFDAALVGPCMRCLGPAAPVVKVDAREVDVPGGGDDLDSPYVRSETLDLASWAHDAFVLASPVGILCKEDCKGLCPVCAANLNEVGEHTHESERDSRWAKLRELKLD